MFLAHFFIFLGYPCLLSRYTFDFTAIPALLELLDITGAIITIDAMGTQTEIAKQIIAKKADYVLALKALRTRLIGLLTVLFPKMLAVFVLSTVPRILLF